MEGDPNRCQVERLEAETVVLGIDAHHRRLSGCEVQLIVLGAEVSLVSFALIEALDRLRDLDAVDDEIELLDELRQSGLKLDLPRQQLRIDAGWGEVGEDEVVARVGAGRNIGELDPASIDDPSTCTGSEVGDVVCRIDGDEVVVAKRDGLAVDPVAQFIGSVSIRAGAGEPHAHLRFSIGAVQADRDGRGAAVALHPPGEDPARARKLVDEEHVAVVEISRRVDETDRSVGQHLAGSGFL